MARRHLSAVAALALCVSAAAQDSRPASESRPSWAEFRGGPFNSGFLDRAAPAIGRVKWVFRAAAPVLHQPALSDGILYFGTTDNVLHAVDAGSGRGTWEKRMGPGYEETESGVVGDRFAFSGPLVFGGRVYAATEWGTLHCVDAKTGGVVWSKKLGRRIWSSPKTDGARVVIATTSLHAGDADETLLLLDPSTGEERGRVLFGYETGASAAVLDGKAWIPSHDRRLHVVDLKTAKDAPIDIDAATSSTPCLALGAAFLHGSGGRLLSVDALTRRVNWRVEFRGANVRLTPACDDKRLYVVAKSTVHAVDPYSGEILWTYDAGRGFHASPVVFRDRVAATDSGGVVHLVDKKSGAGVGRVETGDDVLGSPAAADGLLFVPGSKVGGVSAIE